MKTRCAIISAIVLLASPFAQAAAVSPIVPQDLSLYWQDQQASAPTDVAVMTAHLRSLDDPVFADGMVVHQSWFDTDDSYRQAFRANVVVQIPSKVPGFDTIANAMDADLWVRFSHHGNVYAECRLVVEPVVSRSAVHFAVELQADNGDVKPIKGICDIDTVVPGLQVGVPTLEHGVMVNTVVVGKPFHECDFMVGYCE
jgi:hypothetical protein